MNKPKELTFESIAAYPKPGMRVPRAFAFSPDDDLITYLYAPEGAQGQRLFAFDPATGERWQLLEPPGGGDTEATLSPEEKLRRERARELAVGVTRYAWGKPQRLLVPLNGELYVQDGPEAEPRKLVARLDGAPVLDPRFAPDGSRIAYVQDAELYVIPAAGGDPVQVTRGARGTGRTHGLAEYVAQEEMDRQHGFWWSQDGDWLAFTEVDETHIPVYRIVHQGKAEVGASAQEDHRYPFAGAANARVRLGVVAATGGEPVWMDLGSNADVYLARVQWWPDGSLVVQIEDREQRSLRLLRFDPQTGAAETLLTESSDVWINLHAMLKPLSLSGPLDGGGFVWASERSGFLHLYLYDAEAQLVRALTEGPWIVDGVAGIDAERGLVYFTGNREHPTEKHLYVVPLAGGEVRCVTLLPGWHEVKLDHACTRFVDVHSAPDQPPVVTLRALADGAALHTLHEPDDVRLAELDLAPPEIVKLASRDGVTLYGAVYKPDPATFGPGPYPTVVSVYGGPHAQRVTRRWFTTVEMRAQHLRSRGYLVFVLDNRGSARRGLAFEGAIRHNLGALEVRDQVDGVGWLVAQGLADPERVGIYGWSYGGYMAAMCLLRAPEVFKVAVAGAPVTHWDGYDTHYTERYMGLPQANREGYEGSAVMAHVENLQGKLLLVHGLIDENVHFRHTARLVNALIRARKPYDLLLFPDERHVPRGLADRVYMEERIYDYFEGNV